jgi:membrane protein YqaA with SNARE-associated domain
MDLLVLLAIGIVGTVVPLISPEAAAVGYGLNSRWNPWVIGAVGATGQCVTFALLYAGAAKVLPRWKALNALIERTRQRFADHLERRYLVAVVFGATVGLPPAVGVAALAPGFRVPLLHILPILFAGRVLRLAFLASAGTRLDGLWAWVRAFTA